MSVMVQVKNSSQILKMQLYRIYFACNVIRFKSIHFLHRSMQWKDSLTQQSKTLSSLLESDILDKDINAFLTVCRSVGGFHFFTGVGKNMFVAARVASTFDSLGIRSMYVDPVNTLHGSMGIFTQSDLLIAISKSGETEELNRFVRTLRNQGFSKIASVTSNPNSTLANLSSITLHVPVKDEGDHLGLAPIASTMVFAAVLDSIAVQLSSERGYKKEDFVHNHPGGSLGKTVL